MSQRCIPGLYPCLATGAESGVPPTSTELEVTRSSGGGYGRGDPAFEHEFDARRAVKDATFSGTIGHDASLPTYCHIDATTA